jgi:hypothetical protein
VLALIARYLAIDSLVLSPVFLFRHAGAIAIAMTNALFIGETLSEA